MSLLWNKSVFYFFNSSTLFHFYNFSLTLLLPNLCRRFQTGIWRRSKRNPNSRRSGPPADVSCPQPGSAGPRRTSRRPANQRPTEPSPRPPAWSSPPAPGHPAPPSLQIPNCLWTLLGSQDQAFALPFTQHQRTHVPSPHESRHKHVLSNQRPL